MCGIAGFQGAFDPALLRSFVGGLRHRGPDDSGVWYAPHSRVGLAHCRLSIVDLSPAGHQPMEDATRSTVIVFNGEIYNFRDLRRELQRDGYRFRSESDTEVLLALYRAKGDAMLPHLNGIFAFAACDRSDGTLLLACDSMAVKPLYVVERPEGFLFASELKALMMTGVMPAELDIAAIFRMLGYLWSPGGTTLVKDVRRMGPGEALRIRNGRIVRQWQWAVSHRTQPARVAPRDAIRQVEQSLRTAVHRQMVSDVPVGAFLSGGVDSSAVVAMARERTPSIECFTIDTGGVQDAGTADDLPYARSVAQHLRVPLHTVRIDASQVARDLENMIAHLDEPVADPASMAVRYISRLARQRGVKVLLSGAGGDDLFSGYRRHYALLLERYWGAWPQSVRRTLQRTSRPLTRFGSAGRRVSRWLAHADCPPDRRLVGYFLWTDPARLRGLFADEYRDALADERIEAPLEAHLRALPADMSPLSRMLSLEQRFFLADHNLLYTDKMSMAEGVEVRVPFLDNELVGLVNALPDEIKHRRGIGKWVLKKAMETHLPRHVLHRSKAGFGAPLRRWLRHELRPLVDDTLRAPALRSRGLFDPAAVARLVADDRAGRIDAAYTIFGLMSIELWCRAFLDRRPRRVTGR